MGFGDEKAPHVKPTCGAPGKTFYQSLEQLQADLDHYLNFYNRERAHQGYRTQGRTPYQTLLDGLEVRREEEVKPEAA